MSLLEELHELRTAAEGELAAADSPDALEAWRIKHLGAKGALKAAMQRLRDVPGDQKPSVGKALNELKQSLTDAHAARRAKLGAAGPVGERGPTPDITLPGEKPRIGHVHILTQTTDEICEIFARMGFSVEYGPEVEDERHNFDALNIPPEHPARDELDNFYIDESSPAVGGGFWTAGATMLRSQTSTVQIRVMEKQAPPVRIVAPGRVYRPDTVDATHCFMFHQLEGLYVDEGVSMADLKTCLDQFCKSYFGHEVATRFRPSYFPFTEPSAEVDVWFKYPDGREGWMELGGCGMVHPNVLEAVNYDSEKYTGYAFGMGIERMALVRHQIPDIRLLYESDVRFLHQF
ncbi:MAG TPA: phenylalanine--tRNA ligase subunit alpha [Phycisphaerae bacterium]|nr:phenylalanine--tRNA ligase subunit alpha [Phycisphaerae bacterium]